MTASEQSRNGSEKQAKPAASLWLIYAGFVVAGLLLVGDAYSMAGLDRWTAKLGIGLLWSAVTLGAGRGRWKGYVSAGIAIVAAIATFIF